MTLRTFEAGQAKLVERFRCISNAISENFDGPHYVQPVGAQHRPAVLKWASADGVDISRSHMSPLYLENRTPHPRERAKYYLWQADQSSRLRLRGRDSIDLSPDEFVILTSDMANEWLVPHEFTTTCLVMDAKLVDEYLPHAADLRARHLNLPYGLDAVLRTMFESAWSIACVGRFGELGTDLVRAVLQTLAMVPVSGEANTKRPQRSHLEIRRAQARAFIEQHFARPDMSMATIADHLQVSRRYVQMAFKADCTTPSEYLRTCRLAAAAVLLRDPTHSTRTITEIAFGCGFNSSPHFSSEFKQFYGVSPRTFRNEERLDPATDSG
jgi:AraC-like DNA-binding protein